MTTSIMPHVDLETLLRSGSGLDDGKIIRESLFSDHLAEEAATATTGPGDDCPSESFRLPIHDQLDWLDRHGQAFFDRSESTKANSSAGPHSAPSSHRLSIKKNATSFVFFKLPDSGELSRPIHRKPSSRLIPRPSRRATYPPLTEPGSPKVTCIGRVRSIRDRSLHRQKSKRDTAEAKVTKKSSFWSPIVAIFRFRRLRSRRGASRQDAESNVEASFAAGKAAEVEPARVSWAGPAAEAAPGPGLGRLKQFASGRRTASWGGAEDEETELDTQIAEVEEPVWRRREVGQPGAVECKRDWEDVGPVTV